ncbi:MAG TPA: DUF4136 domain-containing protein [Candidatus Cybelea sp.]|nr:DUF4136 domain-containing protein [Candidatus Cybelea sp.]
MPVRFGCSILLLLVFLPAAVRAQEVSYNYAEKVDFSKFKTYKWVDIAAVKAPSQLLDQDIKEAVEAQLRAKGLTLSDDHPQLFIAYQASVNQEKRITTFYSDFWHWQYGPGWRYGYGYSGPSMSTATSSTMHSGDLVLDIYDAEQKDLVWRGEVSKTLSPGNSPEKTRKNIDKSIAKLFKNYPPNPQK